MVQKTIRRTRIGNPVKPETTTDQAPALEVTREPKEVMTDRERLFINFLKFLRRVLIGLTVLCFLFLVLAIGVNDVELWKVFGIFLFLSSGGWIIVGLAAAAGG